MGHQCLSALTGPPRHQHTSYVPVVCGQHRGVNPAHINPFWGGFVCVVKGMCRVIWKLGGRRRKNKDAADKDSGQSSTTRVRAGPRDGAMVSPPSGGRLLSQAVGTGTQVSG